MRFWIGITDKSWFDQLRAIRPQEVNFWQPSPKPLASYHSAGTPFLFKLHSPRDYVVGGGYFVRHSRLPARLAWEAFGAANGVPDYVALKRRVEQYRKSVIRGDPEIGCNVLNDPFFLEERDWIPIPPDWAKNIVRGRSYDDEEAAGSALLQAVLAVARSSAVAEAILEEPPRYGADYLARARLGQGAFRVLVTEAYGRRCAITGEKTLPVLDAAHIKSYAELGPHQVANGILLRSDLHRLLDSGYITVTPELKVEVSNRLKADFENGREYYRFHGADLTVCPSELFERPSPAFLQWHNETKFLG
jgi:putative restriction endonuclease